MDTSNLEKRILIDLKGIQYQLSEQELWYLAPSIDQWRPEMGVIHPMKFSFLLHNAKIGQGILQSMTWLQDGMEVKSEKRGNAGKAEEILESYRIQHALNKPSRLSSHYLNYTKKVAEHRAKLWNWNDRKLVRCFVISHKESMRHFADIRIFEELARDPTKKHLASKYWENFVSKNEEDLLNLEILVNGSLYFPDWQNFSLMDTNSFLELQKK